MKPIKRPLHAVLDYIYGIGTPFLPGLLGFGNEPGAKAVAQIFGATALSSALMTRHEGGVLKKIPFNTALKLDVGCALLTLASPWLLGFSRNALARNTIVGLALAELAVVALTEPDSAQTRADEDAARDIVASGVHHPEVREDAAESSKPSQ